MSIRYLYTIDLHINKKYMKNKINNCSFEKAIRKVSIKFSMRLNNFFVMEMPLSMTYNKKHMIKKLYS